MNSHTHSPGRDREDFAPSASTVRRILVVTDPNATTGAGQGKLPLSAHLRGFLVDYRDVDALGLCNGSSAPSLARMTAGWGDIDRLNSFSMLSKYQLILVPNERIGAMLCEAMPGLAHHVYALDCFGRAGSGEEPSRSGSPEHTEEPDAELGHWSTFLSHLSC